MRLSYDREFYPPPTSVSTGRVRMLRHVALWTAGVLLAATPVHAGPTDQPTPNRVYEGCAPPGIAHIDAVPHGAEPIMVAVAFGRRVGGRWRLAGDGQVEAAVLGPSAQRDAWRMSRRALDSRPFGGRSVAEVGFPE